MSFKYYQFHGRLLLDSNHEVSADARFKNWDFHNDNAKTDADNDDDHNHEAGNDIVYEFEDDFDIKSLQGQLCSLTFLLRSNSPRGTSASSSDRMQLRVCLPWGGKGTKMGSEFDYCLIKLIVLDPFNNNSVASTRYIHIESGSGECERHRHVPNHHRKLPKEVATFHNPEFCSVKELQSICTSVKYKNEETHERIVADVEVIFRYHVDKLPESTGSNKRAKLIMESEELNHSSKYYANVPCYHPDYSDVIFKILVDPDDDKDGFKILRAHKCVLAAASPIFHSMFTVQLDDKKSKDKTSEIVLSNVSYEALAKFLCLIQQSSNYTRERSKLENMNIRMALEVLELADKYQALGVKDECLRVIIGNPNSEFTLKIALDVYLWGSLHNCEDLCFRSCQWIRRNKSELKTERGRKLLDGFMQKHVLSRSKCSSFLVLLLC